MDGIHDMGGMHGMGPIVREADEPVFHEAWEGRALALTRAMMAAGHFNLGCVLHDQGDTLSALNHLRAAIRTGETLVEADPDGAGDPANLAAAHLRLQEVLTAQDDRNGALGPFRVRDVFAAKRDVLARVILDMRDEPAAMRTGDETLKRTIRLALTEIKVADKAGGKPLQESDKQSQQFEQ